MQVRVSLSAESGREAPSNNNSSHYTIHYLSQQAKPADSVFDPPDTTEPTAGPAAGPAYGAFHPPSTAKPTGGGVQPPRTPGSTLGGFEPPTTAKPTAGGLEPPSAAGFSWGGFEPPGPKPSAPTNCFRYANSDL